jgi:hypothetical protein
MKQSKAKLKQGAQVVDIGRARRPASESRGHCVGRLVSWSNIDGPQVDFPGNPHGPIAARTIIALNETNVVRAIGQAREVLLAFDGDRDDLPIIVGLLEPLPSAGAMQAVPPTEALIDGKRIVLEGQEEIVLRCGKASITLRSNGRVVVRGAYVETRAEGVNRIKGGAVKIN